MSLEIRIKEEEYEILDQANHLPRRLAEFSVNETVSWEGGEAERRRKLLKAIDAS